MQNARKNLIVVKMSTNFILHDFNLLDLGSTSRKQRLSANVGFWKFLFLSYVFSIITLFCFDI